jgi:hypothetical protein
MLAHADVSESPMQIFMHYPELSFVIQKSKVVFLRQLPCGLVIDSIGTKP